MKTSEAVEQFKAGSPLLIVEYRGSETETINWQDKATRKAMSAIILRHNVEDGKGKALHVNERVPENFNPATYTSGVKRGEKCVLHFTSMVVERGIVKFEGRLETLTA